MRVVVTGGGGIIRLGAVAADMTSTAQEVEADAEGERSPTEVVTFNDVRISTTTADRIFV